jgi:V/A-type H+-transporting ATPase subunit A
LLQREEALREVAEIVGLEGMQEADKLILHSAERIRLEFLCQNAYSDDASSPPEKIMAMINVIHDDHERLVERLAGGDSLAAALRNGGDDAPQ